MVSTVMWDVVCVCVCVSHIMAIVLYMSPCRFGLKGKVDVTVEMKVNLSHTCIILTYMYPH